MVRTAPGASIQGLFLEFRAGILRGIWEFWSFKIPPDAGIGAGNSPPGAGNPWKFSLVHPKAGIPHQSQNWNFQLPKSRRNSLPWIPWGGFFRQEIPILAFSGIWDLPNPWIWGINPSQIFLDDRFSHWGLGMLVGMGSRGFPWRNSRGKRKTWNAKEGSELDFFQRASDSRDIPRVSKLFFGNETPNPWK